jgi:hypothetical protein
MFLFGAFDTYMVKVLGGNPKDKCRKLKHHTTFYIQQQAPGNTCGFHLYLNMVAFAVQLESRCKCKCIYFTLLSMFMIKYAYSSFANTHFSFYRGRTMKMLSLT